VDSLELFVSKAEIAYKSGNILQAVRYAKKALDACAVESKRVAIRIFVARCYAKLGRYQESNRIYRELLREDIYFAPVAMGLFYNNFCAGSIEKLNLNLGLVKTCLLLP